MLPMMGCPSCPIMETCSERGSVISSEESVLRAESTDSALKSQQSWELAVRAVTCQTAVRVGDLAAVRPSRASCLVCSLGAVTTADEGAPSMLLSMGLGHCHPSKLSAVTAPVTTSTGGQ